MINGFFLLVVFQVTGEFVVSLLDVPVPGPVAGMLMLFAALCVASPLQGQIEQISGQLVKYIGLLFVPAGAGISLYLDLIAREWQVILLASLSGTIVTLVATAGVYAAVSRGSKAVP